MALQFVTNQIGDLQVTAGKIANATITASQANLTGTWSFASGTLQAAAPSSGADVATKTYVDATAAGLHWKDSVRCATTATGTLASAYENGDAVDGITLATGDRILIKNQSTGSENGIYTVNASGAPTRGTDMDTAPEFPGAAMFVRAGSVNADSGWVCTNDADPTVGTTAITFAQFTGAASLTGGDGITISGNAVAVDLVDSGSGLDFSSGELQIAATGVTSAMLAGSIANGKLSNSSVTVTAGTALTGGGAVALGGSVTVNVADVANAQIKADAAIVYSKLSLTGTIVDGDLAGSISNAKLSNSAVTVTAGDGLSGGGSVALGASVSLAVGVDGSSIETNADVLRVKALGVTNAMLAGSIADTKLSTVSTAGKVAGSAVQLVDTSATLVNNTGLEVKFNGTGGVIKTGTGVAIKLNGGSLALGAGGISIASAGVTPDLMSFQPRKEGITGNGSLTVFNLSVRILSSDWFDGVVLTRNGQVQTQLASGANEVDEYQISDNGTNTQVTFGAAPAGADFIQVMYFA